MPQLWCRTQERSHTCRLNRKVSQVQGDYPSPSSRPIDRNNRKEICEYYQARYDEAYNVARQRVLDNVRVYPGQDPYAAGHTALLQHRDEMVNFAENAAQTQTLAKYKITAQQLQGATGKCSKGKSDRIIPQAPGNEPKAEQPHRLTERRKPKKFRVWFRLERIDQAACARAVRAWVAVQKLRGVSVVFDGDGSTEFEVEQNVMPGIDEASFVSGLKLVLKMEGNNPDNLFYHQDVAIYPEDA